MIQGLLMFLNNFVWMFQVKMFVSRLPFEREGERERDLQFSEAQTTKVERNAILLS